MRQFYFKFLLVRVGHKIHVTPKHLNLLGRVARLMLKVDLNQKLQEYIPLKLNEVIQKPSNKSAMICEEFQDFFQPGLSCMKDCELEIKLKNNAVPVIEKPRTVPFAIMQDLDQAL